MKRLSNQSWLQQKLLTLTSEGKMYDMVITLDTHCETVRLIFAMKYRDKANTNTIKALEAKNTGKAKPNQGPQGNMGTSKVPTPRSNNQSADNLAGKEKSSLLSISLH